MARKILCLMGPTASGKTSLALSVAQKLPVDIVSVDSALVYREMNIGTAKPTTQEMKQAPHHLINTINPDQSYSVAQFCQDAEAAIASIVKAGRIPLLVGGTMMYFKALQQGLAQLPEASPEIRSQLETEAKQKGWPQLHQQLLLIDPVSAAKIKAHDQQRIQRAMEVYRISGIPLSQWLQKSATKTQEQYCSIRLMPEDRAWLHQNISYRLESMLQQGFLDEVRSILARWPLAATKPSMRMVGYRQAMEYLQHGDYEDFKAKTLAATRQLAKRQLTWLRHWQGSGLLHDPQEKGLEENIIALLSK
jgi:tRNA dimethylallyltransferase